MVCVIYPLWYRNDLVELYILVNKLVVSLVILCWLFNGFGISCLTKTNDYLCGRGGLIVQVKSFAFNVVSFSVFGQQNKLNY